MSHKTYTYTKHTNITFRNHIILKIAYKLHMTHLLPTLASGVLHSWVKVTIGWITNRLTNVWKHAWPLINSCYNDSIAGQHSASFCVCFLTHWGHDKMVAIFQTTFLEAFSWLKMYKFRFKISLKFVPQVRIDNIPALVQIMAWRQPGKKPLSKPMMVSLLTHIYASLGLNELSNHHYF